MPGEGKLNVEVEDPHPVIRLRARGRQQESALRQVRPPGDRPHLIIRQSLSTPDDGHRITRERGTGEDINLAESLGVRLTLVDSRNVVP